MATKAQPVQHPDAQRSTRRMPFAQLRSLVVSSLDDDEDDAADEFEAQPTTFRPPRRRPPPPPPRGSTPPAVSRTSTLDKLIAELPLPGRAKRR